MKIIVLLFCSFAIILGTSAPVGTKYTSAAVFAHNDYEKPDPFFAAYRLHAGYIEADIFLRNDSLLIGHTRFDLSMDRKIENMYLHPLDSILQKFDGHIYAGSEEQLTLSVDIKTKGVPTLSRLVQILESHPRLIASPYFHILISGNEPNPVLWDSFPAYIHFDGRPGIDYTPDQWRRIDLVSDNFTNYTYWKGFGEMKSDDDTKIKTLIRTIHSKNKKLRFWATADNTETWKYLMKNDVDILGTDEVTKLVRFLQQ